MVEIQKRIKPWETDIGKVLVKYYRNQARLERLRAVENGLLGNIRELEYTLKCMMNTPKMTASYGYSPGFCGGDGDPLADMMEKLENATIRAREQLPEKYKRLISIKLRIHEVKEWMAPFDASLARMTNEERRILEMKYSWRRSNRNISDLLHCDEKRIRNKHYKIITYLTECLKNMPSCKKSAKSPQKIQSFVV